MFYVTEFHTRDVMNRRLAEAATARLARVARSNRPPQPSAWTTLRLATGRLVARLASSSVPSAALRLPRREEMPG